MPFFSIVLVEHAAVTALTLQIGVRLSSTSAVSTPETGGRPMRVAVPAADDEPLDLASGQGNAKTNRLFP